MSYSERFEDALTFSAVLHRAQQRKGNAMHVPYITHLLGVAAIVGDVGGDEDQVIGALLHDSVEDQLQRCPDLGEQIETRFGARVLHIVLACSDATTHPKPPWEARKQAYIEHLRHTLPDDPAPLVSLADKLYNALTIVRDVEIYGATTLTRFKASPEQLLWYYETLSEVFLARDWPNAPQAQLARDLARVAARLQELIARASAPS